MGSRHLPSGRAPQLLHEPHLHDSLRERNRGRAGQRGGRLRATASRGLSARRADAGGGAGLPRVGPSPLAVAPLKPRQLTSPSLDALPPWLPLGETRLRPHGRELWAVQLLPPNTLLAPVPVPPAVTRLASAPVLPVRPCATLPSGSLQVVVPGQVSSGTRTATPLPVSGRAGRGDPPCPPGHAGLCGDWLLPPASPGAIFLTLTAAQAVHFHFKFYF